MFVAIPNTTASIFHFVKNDSYSIQPFPWLSFYYCQQNKSEIIVVILIWCFMFSTFIRTACQCVYRVSISLKRVFYLAQHYLEEKWLSNCKSLLYKSDISVVILTRYYFHHDLDRNCVPVRIQGIHFINESLLFNTAFAMVIYL